MADDAAGGRIRPQGALRLHDGTDSRVARMAMTAPAEAPAVPAAFRDLAAAFEEVAAGVAGTHRMLLDRVERLSRELEQVRGQADAGAGIVCDGESVTLEVLERRAILATLQRFGGHRDRTARALGIGVRTLGMKLRQWKLAGLAPEHA